MLIVWVQSLIRINLLRQLAFVNSAHKQYCSSTGDPGGIREGRGDGEGGTQSRWPHPPGRAYHPNTRIQGAIRTPVQSSPGAQNLCPQESFVPNWSLNCTQKTMGSPWGCSVGQWILLETGPVSTPSYHSNPWHSKYHYLIFIYLFARSFLRCHLLSLPLKCKSHGGRDFICFVDHNSQVSPAAAWMMDCSFGGERKTGY